MPIAIVISNSSIENPRLLRDVIDLFRRRNTGPLHAYQFALEEDCKSRFDYAVGALRRQRSEVVLLRTSRLDPRGPRTPRVILLLSTGPLLPPKYRCKVTLITHRVLLRKDAAKLQTTTHPRKEAERRQSTTVHSTRS